MYAFSFSNNRFRKVKPVKLGCGAKDIRDIIWKFNHLRRLQSFQDKIENIVPYGLHPLMQLGPNYLPEVVIHELELLKLR